MTRQGPSAALFYAGKLPEPGTVESAFEQAADLAISVDGAGVVTGISVSANCPSLGCLDHWVGRDIAGFLTEESESKLASRLAEMSASPESTPRPIELNHVDNATWEFPVRYTLHRVRASDEILLLGRDMQPIAEVQQQLVKEQLARERDQLRIRAENTFYRVVLDAAEAPILILEPQKGRIRDLNTSAALLLGSKVDTLVGTSFGQLFEGRRTASFMESLQSSADSEEVEGIDAVARRNGRELMIYPENFRAAGDHFMLCRLDPLDEESTTGPELAQSLAALFASASDAIVLTDTKGTLRDANDAFLILTDASQIRDVRGKSFGEFLVRGAIDLKLMLESAAKAGSMRNYSAQIASLTGTRASVEISVARLSQRSGDLGFGFIVRDASQREAFEPDLGGTPVSEEAMKNVMDLVGTASLKELVSATSDVVEKLCIETAVRLTGNNRVAAAEMLGLSRQSLYVKLRKHGLLNGSDSDE
ncbi:transcriptional regulator PpsR [Maritimibacter sp. UBA3975]|uniref:transcriptional regulator PpsR n=1 Tax=Maritimibacter sp. UBA3975 TaxID=1946833 RepID=UPI000C09B453|nr:transcriptional regulator PpsR [Maritimibacter sp. UBA3975]MAM62903.1 transcriptional regulator PpsR [Maritimibacter sp.]